MRTFLKFSAQILSEHDTDVIRRKGLNGLECGRDGACHVLKENESAEIN